MIIRSLLTALTIAAAMIAGPAFGDEVVEQKSAKLVLELFTSQGCSSCPPADKLLKSYVDRDDVVALSMPVDYWDYLGWKDTYAQSAFSERQRRYARTRGDNMVYTPQVVVSGLYHAVGSQPVGD